MSQSPKPKVRRRSRLSARAQNLTDVIHRSTTDNFVPVSELVKSNFDVARMYRTVNPALAFQYVSETPPDPNVRVPAYFNNLNSWLGQTMQRDCGQVS